jgi:hypothetical protein
MRQRELLFEEGIDEESAEAEPAGSEREAPAKTVEGQSKDLVKRRALPAH